MADTKKEKIKGGQFLVHTDKGLVILAFEEPINGLGLYPSDAIRTGELLIKLAKEMQS